MAIFSRLIDIIKANINDLLDRAEDPEKLARVVVEEMEESLVKATTSLAKAMANETKLEKQFIHAQKHSDDLQNKALSAMQAGQEELVKKILNKKIQLQRDAEMYKGMHTDAESAVETLQSQLGVLKIKLDEAKSKESMLVARSQNARARAEVAKQIGEIGDSSFGDFERLEEKVLQMESEAEAFENLSMADVSLEQEINALEDSTALDNEMANLRKQLTA